MDCFRLSLFYILLLTLFGSVSQAQIFDNLRYNPYLKSHTFFDEGSHKISDKNNAWCRGAGLNLFWQAKPTLTLATGYGIGFIDSLKYEENFTNNAAFHQLDINAIYAPFNRRLIQPALFLGYAFNYIPQLKDFGSASFGTNVNLGYQVEVKVKPFLNLRYANTFGISLSEHIRYNFKHELGLVYNLNKFKSSSTELEISDYQARIEQDLKTFDKYEAKLDSLTKISETVADKTIENYKLKETISLVVEQKNKLLQDKALLESNNAILKDTIAELLFFRDSIIAVRKTDFFIIDSIGGVKSSLSNNFSDGFYIAVPNIMSYEEAVKGKLDRDILYPGSSFILYHNGYYTILSYLTNNSEQVINKRRELGEMPSHFRIYKF